MMHIKGTNFKAISLPYTCECLRHFLLTVIASSLQYRMKHSGKSIDHINCTSIEVSVSDSIHKVVLFFINLEEGLYGL